MRLEADSPELAALADVLVGVLVRELIAQQESESGKPESTLCKEVIDRDDATVWQSTACRTDAHE